MASIAFDSSEARDGAKPPISLHPAFPAVVALWFARKLQQRLGGYTGDVLGAAGLVAETVGLLVAAGRW